MNILNRLAHSWAVRAFGLSHVQNKRVRALRVAEEALELAQACGVGLGQALVLVNTVFSRPIGQVEQEVGGTMLTLAVLCTTLGLDQQELFEFELYRVLDKDPAVFGKRNQDKIDLGLG